MASWQRADSGNSLSSVHSAGLKLLAGEQAYEMGSHHKGDNNGDDLDHRVGDQRRFMKIPRTPLPPIGKSDNAKRNDKEDDCRGEGHFGLGTDRFQRNGPWHM